MVKRIQRKRTKGWKMPEGARYVGRPTIWGNPFIHAERAKAAQAYKDLISSGTKSFKMGPDALQFAKNRHENSTHWAYGEYVRDHIHELAGKDLACWCPIDQPCHADILLDLANKPGTSLSNTTTETPE